MDYLLKNELNEASLAEELVRIRDRIQQKRKNSQISQWYFMDQMIRYNAEDYREYEQKLGKRLAILMVHRYEQMRGGYFCGQKLTLSGEWLETAREDSQERFSYVTDESTVVFLYRIQDIASRGVIHDEMNRLAKEFVCRLRQEQICDVVVLYSEEIDCSQVNVTFRSAMLWGNGVVCSQKYRVGNDLNFSDG